MKRRPSGILAVGSITGVCWVLFITEASPWSKSVSLLVGAAVLFVVFAVTLVAWLTAIDRLDILASLIDSLQQPSDPHDRRLKAEREEQAYLRRRAEDARMRELMNPHSQQAPPTDRWYG